MRARNDMHWLAYRVEDNRVVWLRIIRADQRPLDVDVINNGFGSEQEALALMAHYFQTNESGFLTIPTQQAGQHITRIERIGLAFRIEPLLLWATLGAYGLIVIIFLLLVLHLAMGG